MSRDSSKLEVQSTVERPRDEDGGHKWSVKQWSGNRLKCSGNLMVEAVREDTVGSDSTSP